MTFAILLFPLTSCVFSPEGEDEERKRARDSWPGDATPALSADASLDEILKHAYLSNAGLKSRWWAWQAALEQIPQDASQPTTLALTYAQMFENGETSWSQSTFGLVNDPMANFVWPGKLKTAGRRALENARAAGLRFEAARLDLRARVISAWFEFALLAESIRIREADFGFMETAVDLLDVRVRTGASPQQDLVKARTQRDLARSRLETLRSKVPGRRAELNALLNRESGESLPLPRGFPGPRLFRGTDQEILVWLAERNPELGALAREVQGRKEAVTLMRQQYIPEFSLGVSGDGGGIARSIMGMLTLPFLRYPAIEASIAQAKAELEMARTMRLQMDHDLKAKAVLILYDLRNADRQVTLYQGGILPQVDQVVDTTQAAYSAGRAPAVELVDSLRMRLENRLMLAELKAEREMLLGHLEALAGGVAP